MFKLEINTNTVKKYGANAAVLASVLEEYYFSDEEHAYMGVFFEELPKAKYRIFDINTFEKLESLLGSEFPIIETLKRLDELDILDYKKNNFEDLPFLIWESELTVFLDIYKF